MKTILKKQAGFALLEILVFAALLPPALLVASHASDVVSKSSQFFKSSSTKNSLNVIKAYLVTQASNPESDGVFGLQKDATGGSGGALPGALPLNTADEWGTSYRYCNWDTGVANTMNAAFSQNTVGAPGGGVIGQVISAGKDKSFQTACGAASASGDDLLVKVYNSDVLNSQGGITGWKDDGSSVTLLNPADNVGLGVLAPTHKLELAAGTTPAAGIAMGEVEIYRSALNTLSLSTGNSLNLDSGTISIGGSIVVDAARNMAGNNLTLDGGTITINNNTSNSIVMGNFGKGSPTVGVRSLGTKLLLWSQLGVGSVDYAQGIEDHAMWSSVPEANPAYWFKWYGGTTNVMTLDGAGHLGVGTAPNPAYSINSNGAVNASAYYLNGVLTTQVAAGSSPGQTLYWDGTSWTATNGLNYNAGTGAVNIATGPLQMGGTTVVDSLRYLTGVSWVAQNFNPAINNTYDLGNGPAGQWRNIYSQNIYQNGNKVADVFGSAIGYVPKFTGLNTLGNSLIYDNGTNVGIGTASPGYRLDVWGSPRTSVFAANDETTWATGQVFNATGITGSARGIKFGDSDGTKGAGIVGISKNTTGGRMELGFITSTGNVSYERMRIDENGNIGMGTTAPWAATKLDVHQSGNPGLGGWGVAGYFHTSGGTGSNIAVNPEAIVATTGTNYGLYATAANGAAGNVAIYVPAAYPPAGANNYSLKLDSLAKSSFAGDLLLGLSTPVTGAKLEVNGTASFTSTVDAGTVRSASYLVAKDAAGNTANSGVNFNALTLGKDGTNGMGWIQSYGAVGGATQATQINPLGGNVLMGTTSDNGSRLQVSAPALASFTGGGRGAASFTIPYDGAAYTGLDFNYSTNGGVQARIAAQLTGSGSYLHFGTSNNYGSGVTNTAMSITPSGNISMTNNLIVVGNLTASSFSGPVAGSSYGGMTLSGTTSGYSGIYESAAAGTVVGMYDGAGNGGDYDSVTGWHFYWNRANASLGIGGSATTGGYKAQVNGSLNTVGNANVTGHVQTAGGILTGGAIYRTAAGTGYLDGGYSGIETTATSGPIYSIGGSYVPTATTLGNMYGIGYGYSGNAGIAVTGLPASRWGMYVASGGISRIFLDSDTGSIYANGGATFGAAINVNGGGNFQGSNFFFSNKGAGAYLGVQSVPGLQVTSTDTGAAFMSFIRSGLYGVNMGLDPDNVLRIGGWSAAANRWSLDMSGNMSTAGQINAGSNGGAGGYVSSGNYGGTGLAAWFPSGIYSAGTNWLYGTVVFNGTVSGASTISATSSMSAPDFYAGSWFRNNSSLTGLYNTVNGNHFYSESAPYWSLATGSAGHGGLVIRDTHQGPIKGYLYHNGDGFGLLHSAGGWAVRVTPTTTDLYGTTITARGDFVSTGTVTGTTVHNAVYN